MASSIHTLEDAYGILAEDLLRSGTFKEDAFYRDVQLADGGIATVSSYNTSAIVLPSERPPKDLHNIHTAHLAARTALIGLQMRPVAANVLLFRLREVTAMPIPRSFILTLLLDEAAASNTTFDEDERLVLVTQPPANSFVTNRLGGIDLLSRIIPHL